MSSRYSSCLSLTSPNIFSLSTSEKPMMALSGVRSSCDMLARNSDLCLFASSSSRLLSWISLKRRAFWIAITAWSAKVFRSVSSLALKGDIGMRETWIAPTPRPSQSMGAKAIE